MLSVACPQNDAMGVSVNHRGFADRNLFVAQSSQERVVPMEVEVCDRETDICNTYRKRVSYAVPLEVRTSHVASCMVTSEQ